MEAKVPAALIPQSISRKFIDGCHILHLNRVLDAYGHLSFRHPEHHGVFVMSHSIAPGTISSPDDFIAYQVDGAEPVMPTQQKGYEERRIHSEIYRLHPDVHAVVHSHSEVVVPYSISGAPMKACYHMAGFLGATGAAVFDIAKHRGPNLGADMLVRTEQTGVALAKTFDNANHVTLMRGHGFTLVADSIEVAVMWAVYTQKNALIQTTAATVQSLYNGPGSASSLHYLDQDEASMAETMTKRTVQRPWQLWVLEVEASGLYVNKA